MLHPAARESAAAMERRRYRITVRARLSDRLASAFEGVAVEHGAGETSFVGLIDQSQLYGILDRVREFGLELLRVEEVAP
jgi:hypothetical protein